MGPDNRFPSLKEEHKSSFEKQLNTHQFFWNWCGKFCSRPFLTSSLLSIKTHPLCAYPWYGCHGWKGGRTREMSPGEFISLFTYSQLHWENNSVIQWKYVFPLSFWTGDPNTRNGRSWDWWGRDLGEGGLSVAQNSWIHLMNKPTVSNPRLTEWPLCVKKPARPSSKSHLCSWDPKCGWIRSQGSC